MKIIPGEHYTFRPRFLNGAPDTGRYDGQVCVAMAHPMGHPAVLSAFDVGPYAQHLIRFDDGCSLLAFTSELVPVETEPPPPAFEIGQRCRFTDEQRIERSRISGTVCEVIEIIRLSPRAEPYYRVRFDYGHVLWTLGHDLEALPADVEAGA